MQMDDEVAHVRVVDRLLRLRLPGGIGAGVIGIDADDIEIVEVLELDGIEPREFAAEHQVKQLSRRDFVWHVSSIWWGARGVTAAHRSGCARVRGACRAA